MLQLEELLACLREQPGTPTWLIAGDLNVISQSPVIRRAEAAGLALGARNQRPWDTVNINGNCRKLDYLLYTRGQLCPSPGPLPKLSRDTPMPSSTEPSDHLPLRADFAWC